MSDSLPPYGLQHSRLLCPSLAPWVCSRSYPFRCCLTMSASVAQISFCFQSFPAIGSFPMNWLFALGGQSIEASISAWILPMNIQGWFPLGLTDLISLQSNKLSRVFSSNTIWKHQFFSVQPSLQSNSHIHTWLLEKP